VLNSRSCILSVRPEPHPLTVAGAVKRCGSGAKPDVQNRTIKKKQELRSRIILMRLWVTKFWCGSRSSISLRLRLHQNDAAPAPQHWKKQSRHPVLKRVYYVLNKSSKQELSEPHGFTAPAPPDDVARCGSIRLQLLHRLHSFSIFLYFKFDFTKFIKVCFFYVLFGSDLDPDPGSGSGLS
jgi:hypothetical protein